MLIWWLKTGAGDGQETRYNKHWHYSDVHVLDNSNLTEHIAVNQPVTILLITLHIITNLYESMKPVIVTLSFKNEDDIKQPWVTLDEESQEKLE